MISLQGMAEKGLGLNSNLHMIYAHTCKSWISPVSDRTYLNILDMMNSPENVTHLAMV